MPYARRNCTCTAAVAEVGLSWLWLDMYIELTFSGIDHVNLENPFSIAILTYGLIGQDREP